MLVSDVIGKLISFVAVLLLLSLMVQSIQEIAKRVFRIKARLLERTLGKLFSKAELEPAEVSKFLLATGVDFGRNRVSDKTRSAAETVSKDDIVRWLSDQPTGVCAAPLRTRVAEVNKILEIEPAGTWGPVFAGVRVRAQAFVVRLPAQDQDFTYGMSKEQVFNVDWVMRALGEILADRTKPAAIEELPAKLTAVVKEWEQLKACAARQFDRVDKWFDTAAAAFHECYQEQMRWWTLGISFVVCASFDADFFDLAKGAFSGAEMAPALALSCPVAHGPMDWIGWAITTILISAGAPFWQDALQSLLGLKNFLRRPTGESKGGALLGSAPR